MTKSTLGSRVDLGFGINAYVSLGMAGFFCLLPLTAGLAPVVGLFGGFDPGAGASSPVSGTVLGILTALSIVVAPWLVPCLVLRARQPKGARIVWDGHEIAEWNGSWKRTAIRWEDAEGARLEWQSEGRSISRRRVAVQVLDKTNPRSLITAWEEEPEGVPILRRRLEGSRRDVQHLDGAIQAYCGPSVRAFETERLADPERPVQRKVVRWFTRLGYAGGFFGPLLAGEAPFIGIWISVVAAILLAWRAAPVFVELFRVHAKLVARPIEMPAQAEPYREMSAPLAAPRGAEEILAWRYRFRAVVAEALVRGTFAILPIVGAVASALTDYR